MTEEVRDAASGERRELPVDTDPSAGDEGEPNATESAGEGSAASSDAPAASNAAQETAPSPAASNAGPEGGIDFKDKWLRSEAELQNFRRRAQRDREDSIQRAQEYVLLDVIGVLDDLERALAAAEEHEEAKLEEGVRLVHRELKSALDREGLAEIETNGVFDPHVHEALLSQPSEAEEGSVLEVLQKGYKLGDRVLRPARVVVASAPEAGGR